MLIYVREYVISLQNDATTNHLQACVKIYQYYQEGNLEKARALQAESAKAEWWLNKTGINGTKWVVAEILGYGESKSATRRPYPLFTDENVKKTMFAALQANHTQEQSL
jgi:4-hydroxy-2-oxoglutarate aldolase